MSDNTKADPTREQMIFEQLFKQSHSQLVTNLAGMVRDRDGAEDLAATAFQRAWDKFSQFRGDSSLATWVQAIGRNAARSSWHRVRSSRQDSIDRLEKRPAALDPGSESLEREDLRARVRDALARIPAKHRRILINHYIDGRPVREIARRERVPAGTVLSRLFTAREALRAAWSETTVPTEARDMSAEKAQRIAEEAVKHLTEELQAGRSEALKTYLAAMARFHRYSWNNAILIQSQRPAATRVAGFHTWHQLGRSVKRGEKGIAILAPIRAKQAELASRHSSEPEKASQVVGFRTAYVFDVEQTEGRPLPAFATTTGDPREFMDRLKAFVAQRGIALEYDVSIAPAQGLSSGGRIQLQPGMPPAEEFSVLAHELAHEMLHHSQRDTRLSKQIVETQAEAVAFVVCRGVGLETGTAAADYIALYNGDPKTLAQSLTVIQEASSTILKELLPDERAPASHEHAADSRTRLTPAPQPSAEGSSPSHRTAASPSPDPGDSISLDR